MLLRKWENPQTIRTCLVQSTVVKYVSADILRHVEGLLAGDSPGAVSVLPGEDDGVWESEAGNGLDHTDAMWPNQKPKLHKGLPATSVIGRVEVILFPAVACDSLVTTESI